MRRTTVIIAAVLALVAAASADWASVGPEGGPMYCGTVTRSSPPTLYVAASIYNTPLLRTTDGGADWSATAGVLGNYPWALVSHPTDPNTMYGVISSIFYRTTNAGASWNQYSLGSNTIGYDLALNPLDTQVLYSAGYKYDGSAWRLSCMKTTDGGQDWTATQLDTASSAYGYSVAIDPVDTNVVYVGGYAGSSTGFYKTTDGGAHWTSIAWPENDYYIYSLLVSPTNHDIVFAGTLYGILRSTDAGATWNKVCSNYYNYRLAVSPDNPNLMYSAAYTAVYYSTDAGLTWNYSTTGIEGTNMRLVLTVPGDTNAVYCGSTAGMFKSTDHGQTWAEANHGILIGSIPVVTFDAGASGTAYAEFTDNAIFKTTDGGGTWERQPTVLSCGNVCSIVIEPGNPLMRWLFEGSG